MMKQRVSKAPPTLQSLSQMLGLSRTTIAEILGGKEGYAKETVARVQEAALSLNYQPNRSAQNTRRGSSNLIGVMHTSGPLQVVNERAHFLGRYIAETGYDLLLTDSLWSYNRPPLANIDYMVASRVEGFIFSGPGLSAGLAGHPVVERIEKAHIPMILISSSSINGILAINSDFAGGYYQLARHLMDGGRRRLTLLLGNAPEANWHSARRLAGFVRAIEEAGGSIAPPAPMETYRRTWRDDGSLQGEILYFNGSINHLFYPYDPPQQAMNALLDRGFDADAILAANDDWAAGIIATCMRRGIDIPGRLAVTGYDNGNVCSLSPVPITSVSQQSDETCRLAVEHLLGKMRGENTTAGPEILVPNPIVIRDSSGGGLQTWSRRQGLSR